jgi:hypothetical protein
VDELDKSSTQADDFRERILVTLSQELLGELGRGVDVTKLKRIECGKFESGPRFQRSHTQTAAS